MKLCLHTIENDGESRINWSILIFYLVIRLSNVFNLIYTVN